MQVCVLGPLVVRNAGAELDVGGRQQRRILARLAMDHGRPVGISAIELALWGETPPATSRHTIASRVFQLRAMGLTIETAAGNYVLADDTDVATFEDLLTKVAGTSPDGPSAARGLARLRAALDIWRGQPYADLDDLPEAIAEATRLTELADDAHDRLLAGEINSGDVSAAIAEARRLVADRPYRERRWELLMLALYRSGRQADALAAYGQCRRILVDELGIEPGPALRRMQQAVLSQDPGLDPAAPTLARTRLPGTSTRFVGRERERRDVTEVWARTRLATIVGPPGAGKTRLALEAARTEHEPVWYLAVEQLVPDQSIASAILGAVAPASHATDASAGIRDALGETRGLLLLDGSEGRLAEIAAEVGGLLVACPGLRILLTSRERTGHVDEALIPISGLPVAEAAELLEDRARLMDPRLRLKAADTAAVERLCGMVDGLPLAIELIARHLLLLDVEEVADRVASDLGRWAGRPSQGRAGLWAALDGSFARLRDDDRALLTAMSVMAADADIALIEEVAGLPSVGLTAGRTAYVPGTDAAGDRVFDVLAGLVDASLVQVRSASGRTRYEVLQTIGAYTRGVADAGVLASATNRYRAAVLRTAESLGSRLAGSSRSEVLSELDREMPHIRSVLGAAATAAELADRRRALEVAVGLTDYWLSRRPAEGLLVFGRLVDVSDPPPALRAEARLRQAHLAYWLTQFDEGAVMAAEARDLSAALGDAVGEGRALRRLGAIAAATDDMDAARGWLEASLTTLERADSIAETGVTLLHLGSLLADEGAAAEAVPLLERAHAIALERDDPLALGHVLAALTLAEWKGGRLGEALATGEEALTVFGRLGHRTMEGAVAYRLAAVARALGRPRAARRYGQLAIDAGEQVQTRTSAALGHVSLARLDLDLDDVDAAADHLLRALDLHDPVADRWVLVEVLEAVARLAAMTRQPGGSAVLAAADAIRATIRQPVAPTEAIDVQRTRTLTASERIDVVPGADPRAAHTRAAELLAAIGSPGSSRPRLVVVPRDG